MGSIGTGSGHRADLEAGTELWWAPGLQPPPALFLGCFGAVLVGSEDPELM